MSEPNWSRGLRGSALRIASNDDPRLRVVAGPGAGKSFALKRRVARLLEQGQDPKRILAVTFTRTAAADILQDLRSLEAVRNRPDLRQYPPLLLLFSTEPSARPETPGPRSTPGRHLHEVGVLAVRREHAPARSWLR